MNSLRSYFLQKKATKTINKKPIKTKKFRLTIHPVTFVIIFLSIFAGMFWLTIEYLFCLLFHELSHALVSKKLGYRCDKICLYPSGAILYGETDEFCFKDEILISLAGPASNLFLCLIIVTLWWIAPDVYNYTTDLVVANLSLALFNLLPIFPLDGGRVLLAFFSLKLERKLATKFAKIITYAFAFSLLAIFVISLMFSPNLQLGYISIITLILALSEDKSAVYKRVVLLDAKKQKLGRGLKVCTIAFDANTPIFRARAKIDNYGYYKVLIVFDELSPRYYIWENMLEKLMIINSSISFEKAISEYPSYFCKI